MSTTLPTPSTDRSFAQRWRDFWFAPRDPTTLGFMRIMTGLLILYIHLAYSLDLQAFFGRYAWYNSEAANRERREFPWVSQSFWDWQDPGAMPRLPEFPHRRKAVLDFVNKVGDMPPTQRQHALRYLNRIVSADNPGDTYLALRYVRNMGTAPATWEARKKRLVADPQEEATANDAPPFIRNMPKEMRAQVADEIDAFLKILPPDANTPDRDYVLSFLEDRDQPHRREFAQFITTLPADPTERAKLIDYVSYWDNDPRKTLRQGHGIFSIWFHVTDPTQMAIIHSAILVIMLLFTIGFCTRVTSVLTWLAAMCYIQRAQQVLFGMDTMMNILLFYLMIGNSGAALSVDRLIARFRAARDSVRRSGTIDPATRAFLTSPPPSASAGLAIRLVQVHFCFIYMAAGLSKLQGPGWWTGNAFWDVMANPEFTLIRYQWYEHMLRAMVSVKPLYYIVLATGVWFTLALEIAFPFLVWTRLRPFMVWLGILLHAGIGVLMGLNLFELLMMVMLLAYLPSAPIRERLRGGPDLPRVSLAFDSANPAHARAAAVIIATDIDAQVNLDARKIGAPTLAATGGTSASGREAVELLFSNIRFLRLFKPLIWIPGMKGVFARWLFPAAADPATAPRSGPQAPAAAS